MKELFSTEEWSLITQAPYIIFRFVAGIDGKVDNKELDAFSRFCKSRNYFSSKLLKEVLPDNPEEYLKSYEGIEFTKQIAKEKLRNIDLILDHKTDQSDSISFKHHLISLGDFVASASGRLFDSKVSEDEYESLIAIGNYLDIDVIQLFKSTLKDEIQKKVK